MDRASDRGIATQREPIDGPELDIRPLATIAEFHACEQLQRDAWGFDGDLDVIPLTQMMAVQKSGGIALGAFTPDGRLGGFAYGFLGRDSDGRLLHYSHMTAVDAALRSSGLGARLKWAQLDAAIAQGLDLMVWTYDPLESLNGHFNFHKLGIVARRYSENYYGETTSALHRGMPTDRLRAEWQLCSERVRARRERHVGELAKRLADDPQALPEALVARRRADGLAAPDAPCLDLEAEALTCEIPASIQTIKRADPELALEWRLATRAVLGGYLGRGYEIRECVRTRENEARTLYVLCRPASTRAEAAREASVAD